MSPLDVSILIHACCRADEVPNRGASAVEESIRHFHDLGAIKFGEEPNAIVATEKGQAWLRLICRVGEPSQAWVDGEGKVID